MRTPIEAWRRRWEKWMQQLRRRKRKHPHLMALLRFMSFVVLIVFVELLILLSFLIAGLSGLLDLRTIVSVMVPEVAITIVLYYLLGGHRRERLDETVNLMDACARFRHLRIYTYRIMSLHYYYVENTLTKQAYKASSVIESIVDEGIFEVVKCKDQREMKRKLRKNQTKLNDYEPLLTDLLNPNIVVERRSAS
jgi:hypothetical protein